MNLILLLLFVGLNSGCFYYDDSGYPQLLSTDTLSVTVSGYPCRRWDDSISIEAIGYNLGSQHENYCRNPNKSDSVWCISTNPNKLVENCNPKGCGCYFIDDRGHPKSTGTLSVTETGYTCMRWDEELPQTYFEGYPVEVHKNYCRNPDEHTSLWCYSTNPSKEWENCNPAGCATTSQEVTTTALTRPQTTSAIDETVTTFRETSNSESTVEIMETPSTTAMTTEGINQCLCPCNTNSMWSSFFYGNLTNEEKSEIIEKEKKRLRRELTVDKTVISSYIMKKKCANDERSSAKSIGNVGIGILVIFVTLIILSDITNFKCFRNNKNTIDGE